MQNAMSGMESLQAGGPGPEGVAPPSFASSAHAAFSTTEPDDISEQLRCVYVSFQSTQFGIFIFM